MTRTALWIAAGLGIAGSALAQPLSGVWRSEADPSLQLTLTEATGGSVRGTLESDGSSATIDARRGASGFAGTANLAGEALPCSARFEGAQLVLTLGAGDEAESVLLQRAGAVAPARDPVAASPPASARQVVVNATRLSASDLARIERDYRLRIPDARFWYDPISGAWGGEGGPTAGFLRPGLQLGGELRSEASGGGTGVFVNGRELHAWDVLALSQLLGGPILPARYFLTAEGFAGFEGGPPQWNLVAMAMAAGGTGGGGGRDTTWSSRLSSGIDGGSTGAIFTPNGGMVHFGD
ncbi:MAG: hypothetical protein FJ091_08750 [Deltaproteobacteria bacterium]|nr:hypothetical protein [Deltaproteobacteria bacterium]